MAPPTAEALHALSLVDVREAIPADEVAPVLQSAPFVVVPGTFNTRDLGLVPSASEPAAPGLRSGFAYRSGMLGGLTDEGKRMLTADLGVRRVFDVRTAPERERQPEPSLGGGAEGVWRATKEADATVDLTKLVEDDGVPGFAEMYVGVLDQYKETFKAVLEHVRDRPEEPFLFHCTAGRDRTGVLAGMLMTLAGTPHDAVVLDYLLSRVGTEPAREQLLAIALRGSHAEDADTPGFLNLCSLRERYWDAFAGAVEREWGGFDGYVQKTLGFNDADLKKIKENLVAKPN